MSMNRKQRVVGICAGVMFSTVYVVMLASGWLVGSSIARLSSDDPKVRGEARMALTAGGKSSLPTLLRGLRNREPNVRRECIKVLKAIGDASVIPELRVCLKDPDPKVRTAAKHALVSLHDPKVLPLVVQDLDGSYGWRQMNALADLAQAASPETLTALLDERTRREQATRAYWQRYHTTGAGGEKPPPGTFEIDQLIARMGSNAVDELMDREVANWKGKRGETNYLDLLRNLAESANAKLVELLNTKDETERMVAALALYGEGDDSQVRSALFRVVRDESNPRRLRAAALSSLDHSNNDDAEAFALSYLNNPKAPSELRAAAVDAIRHSNSEKSRQTVLAASKDADPAVRRRAADVFLSQPPGSVPASAVAPLLEDDDEIVRNLAAAVVRDSAREAVPHFETLARSKDPKKRLRAAQTVKDMDDPSVEAICERLILDPNEEVSSTALLANDKHKTPKMLKTLLTLARTRGAPESTKSLLANGLYDWDLDKVRPVLLALMDDEDPDLVVQAVSSYTRRFNAELKPIGSKIPPTPHLVKSSLGTLAILSKREDYQDVRKFVRKGSISVILVSVSLSDYECRNLVQLRELNRKRKDLVLIQA
ncbi:MAG: hypothetical protein COS85_08835 [Armatimonadetes bacterium CG07_land_8_20_14_0_80_59_28]|nr:MAG: hypothetical protein COS85_08835 [Armatimonadetes bacterium CG07_land_8_20_14_0_80_59_28]PIX41226.1 MAG: hypothetical protein COZ56_12555 [Armatimonadetes bacterium CG_4_8_14_3_um_filter_58_9]PJB74414.1 MAG: hypothetical protein CO095_04775 [Armatimonadetes bacterium CG_4_9_14_3_um_filter_58_7]